MGTIRVGDENFATSSLPTPTSVLLAIRAPQGILGCGYLSTETADKLGEAMAIVTGVKSPEEMLEAKVVRLSQGARELGIQLGDTGKQALEKMG